MNKVIASGVVTTIAMLGMVSPAFAATTTYTYPPTHASSTTKVMHATTTPPVTGVKTTAPKAKVVLLIGSVGQNTTGLLTVIVKTKTYNVTVGSTVPVYSKTGKMLTQGDIKAGDKIRVRGQATGTEVTATSMRDLSL